MEQHTRRKLQGFLAVVGITFVILLIGFPGARHSVTAATAAIKATLMRDVDNPANAPFAKTIEGNTPYQVPATLPDGRAVKRLVIEFVSGFCFTPSNDTPILYVSLSTTAASQAVQHFITPTHTVSTYNRWQFTEEVRLYADPDSVVATSWSWLIVVPAQQVNCDFHLSGHFVTQ